MNNRTKTTLALSLLVLAGLAGIVFHADGIVYGQSAYAFSPDTLRQDTTKNKRPDGTRTSNPVTDLTLQDLIPPAPAAMEIAKGIAYPVDLSSGLLNIEIPLYEIVSGDIRIPITLSYHASGLKPGIHSRTWLPQGWSLSVGPTLSRVIRGGPDEYVYDAATAAAASPTWTQLNAVAEQAVDIALDEFFYSLPGHSGKLYFTRTPSGGFSSTLRYTDPSRSTTTGKYDGSISEWTWSRETGSTAQTYGFSYDGLGRLTGAKRYTGSSTTSTNAFTEQGLVYDRNGNVTALRRYGASASAAEDDFAFNVTDNRISSLTNTGTNGSGATYTSYTYDANGNTTHDGRTGQDLAWNELNLISGVSTTSGGNTSQLASYTWMADGAKYASARADGTGYVYKGALVFERGAAGKLSLDAALTTGGRITAQKDASTGAITGYTVHHHITDHLGSVRAVVDFAGNVLETSDFLPYGTRWSQTGGSAAGTLTDAANRWRYSGKEEQAAALNPALPLIDYGARMYDPAIARWMSVDPLAEKYYPMGGYNYCAGNPVILVDTYGRIIRIYYQEGGKTKYVTYRGKNDGNITNDYVKEVIKAYHYNNDNWIKAGYPGKSPLAEIVEREDITVSIMQHFDTYGSRFDFDQGLGATILWNSNEGSKYENGVIVSPATVLSHEADHANDYLNNAKAHEARRSHKDSGYGNNEERRVIEGSEQKTARANGEISGQQVTRRSHNGKTIITSGGATSTQIDRFETAAYETKRKHDHHW